MPRVLSPSASSQLVEARLIGRANHFSHFSQALFDILKNLMSGEPHDEITRADNGSFSLSIPRSLGLRPFMEFVSIKFNGKW
jgi:hypothetical protein